MGPHVLGVTAGFFENNLHWPKMTENGQKWPETWFFDFLKKNSLVLSGICVK